MAQSITRTNASPLIPEEYSREILKSVPANSAVLTNGRRLPDISRNQYRMPVMSGLPQAYFVNGDTGLKQTSKALWENVYINVEEIAVIIPIAEAVLDDADYDIWGEVTPRAQEAFGALIDKAALYSVNKPSSWPDGVAVQAAAAGHVVDLSTHEGAGGDYYSALLSPGGIWSFVEEDGYEVTGIAALPSQRARMRGLRDSQKQPIFKSIYKEGVQGATRYELDGTSIFFQRNIQAADANNNLMIAGQWDQLVWAMRQDMTFKILTEATIQDNAGNTIYNLAQQDMVALRLVMRLGWALPNPAALINEDKSTRFPFGVLVA